MKFKNSNYDLLLFREKGNLELLFVNIILSLHVEFKESSVNVGTHSSTKGSRQNFLTTFIKKTRGK